MHSLFANALLTVSKVYVCICALSCTVPHCVCVCVCVSIFQFSFVHLKCVFVYDDCDNCCWYNFCFCVVFTFNVCHTCKQRFAKNDNSNKLLAMHIICIRTAREKFIAIAPNKRHTLTVFCVMVLLLLLLHISIVYFDVLFATAHTHTHTRW